MPRHILRIIYSKAELDALPDTTFGANQEVYSAIPFNPLPDLWKPGTAIGKQSDDYNRERNFRGRAVPFSIAIDSYLNDKNSLKIFIEGEP